MSVFSVSPLFSQYISVFSVFRAGTERVQESLKRKVDTTHNTTNQIDYKIYCNVQGGGGNMTINPDTTNALGNFSAMEIGA